MKKLMLLSFLAMTVFMAGCATVKSAVDDYKVGATTPLEEGELSPAQQAAPIQAAITPIPVVGGFAPVIGGALAGLFTLLRGRRIRKGQPQSQNPITGFLGQRIGAETVVQSLANIAAGLFEVGGDGSPFKRAWKMGLSTALSIGVGAMTIPAVQDFVVHNPMIAAGITGLSALFGGLEKAVSVVKPVDPAATEKLQTT